MAIDWLDKLLFRAKTWLAGGVEITATRVNVVGAVESYDSGTDTKTLTLPGSDGGASLGVASLAALRAIGAGSRANLQMRVVGAERKPYVFLSAEGAGLADSVNAQKPDDLSGASAGRWYALPQQVYTVTAETFVGRDTNGDSLARAWISSRSAIGTSVVEGFYAVNVTPAAAGAQQYSQVLFLRGSGWKTDATAASQNVDFVVQCRPIQGAAAPTGELHFLSQVNGGGFTSRATLSTAGKFTATTLEAGTFRSAGTVNIENGSSAVDWYNGASFVRRDTLLVGACGSAWDAAVSSISETWTQDASAAGGAWSRTGQQGAAGFAGGAVSLNGGSAGSTGLRNTGGTATLAGGDAGGSSGDPAAGGAALVTGGIGSSSNGAGGEARVIGGTGGAGGTSNGGDAIIRGGTAGGGAGGSVRVQSANATDRIQADDTGLGFFAATPVAKPTVTGSRGGNAALADLLTKLASLGLITDSTS